MKYVLNDSSDFGNKTNRKNFLWKKERFHFAGYRAQGLSIAARMLYHLSYGGSTQLFKKFHLVLNEVNLILKLQV